MSPFPTEGRLRELAHWLSLRDAGYIGFRSIALLRRYGILATRAKRRVIDCVLTLAKYGCRPTFPTPGQIVASNDTFCRQLHELGAELAIHGYHHVDFRALSPDESRKQFTAAAAAYRLHGIPFEGFRCPYLSYTERLRDALPDDHFEYGSNKAIWWDVVSSMAEGVESAGPVFQGLSRLYRAQSSGTHVAVPSTSGRLIEIPVSLPDDLQLLDGLKLDERGLSEAWMELLRQTHRRGELFDLLFHPESFDRCGPALEAVLRASYDLAPRVWIAQLREINRWWREKASFRVDTIQEGQGLRYTFRCSDRATILVRNMEPSESTRAWYGSYRLLERQTLRSRKTERPFVGVAPEVPPGAVGFLREQGYIVESGPAARSCATYLNATGIAHVRSQIDLIDLIESSSAPLVRFWRWPNGARSALCVTGDLDALSLVDYAKRVFAFR